MATLRVLVAPSGFKESLSAEQAAAAIAEGIRRAAPDSEVTEIPLVDGGEGFSETLVAVTGGDIHRLQVTGPVGEKVDSHFGTLGDKSIAPDDESDKRADKKDGSDGPANDASKARTAVLEMAAAAGLRLVPKSKRDPLRTTTYGVGELIKAALDSGAKKLLIGCGDSGTNDGGAGAAEALGVRLLKTDGTPINRGAAALLELDCIDLSQRDARLEDVEIDVALNIHNILCGEHGVARVFGPQKGASPETIEKMEEALERYAEIIKRDTGVDVRLMPGGGASGGLGAGLHALLGARLHQRYEIVMKYLGIDEALKDADLVFTAEGGIDFQTPRGKIPAEVASRAKKFKLPVIAIAGTIGKEAEINYEHGIDAIFSMLKKPCTLDEAIADAGAMLTECAENVMRTVMLGRALATNKGAGDVN
ncbi:MAG: glycerate kinase [Acidobacteriota bacterium]|nr:glycerate kinase [Acidobacteriota bacterium]